MKVFVGTKNIKKAEIVRKLFTELFPDQPIEVANSDVKSDVPDTPWELQTYLGAKNRVKNAIKSYPGCDFYVGLETGLVERYGELFEETWCFISTTNDMGYLGYGSGCVIGNSVKRRIQEDNKSNTKILEIYDIEKNDFIMYSGDPKIREISLSNAIKASLSQIVD